MKREHSKAATFVENIVPIEGIRIGRIVRMDDSGCILVDFPGNSSGPIVARTTSSVKSHISDQQNLTGREVLLAFENNNPGNPIIIDTMYSLIEEITESATAVFEADEPHELTLDGKRMCFEAENEIVLKCGKASITLTSAGKVLIKGEYVLSHSSGENRIRGGSISIN